MGGNGGSGGDEALSLDHCNRMAVKPLERCGEPTTYQISRASGFKAFQPEKKKMLYFQVCGIFMK